MTEPAKHKATRSDTALTPVCRLVYIYVHEKRTKDGTGKDMEFPRYEMNVLVPKLNSDPAQCANYAMLSKHCMDACTKQPGWGGFPAGGHWPINDGDAPPKAKAAAPGIPAADPAIAAAKYAYRKGHWFIEVNSYSEIGPRVCVMQGNQVLEIPARVINGKVMYKSGDYGIVSLHSYTFHNKTWGVKFGFEGVLFTAPGEAIGGTGGPREASQMFGSIGHVAQMQAPPAGPPMAPQAPVPTQHIHAGVNAAIQAVAPSPPMAPAQPVYASPPVAPVAGPPAAPVAPVPGAVGLPPLPR